MSERQVNQSPRSADLDKPQPVPTGASATPRLICLADIEEETPEQRLARWRVKRRVRWWDSSCAFQPHFRWVFEPRNLVLYLGDPATGAWCYYVDLERCTTSAEVCDWIFQIAKKLWASDDVLAELIHALDDVLVPQGTLCSCGTERGPLDVRRFLRDRGRPVVTWRQNSHSRRLRRGQCSP